MARSGKNTNDERVLNDSECRLLALSNITANYSWLVRMINEKPKCKWSELPEFAREQPVTSLLIAEIVAMAGNEWVYPKGEEATTAEKGQKLLCQLCNRRICLAIFPIVNQFNGKRLLIGCVCAKNLHVRNSDLIEARHNSIATRINYAGLLLIHPDIEEFITGRPRTERAIYKLPDDMRLECVKAYKLVRDMAEQYRDEQDEEQMAKIAAQITPEKSRYRELCEEIDRFEEEQRSHVEAVTRADMEAIRKLHGKKWASVNAKLKDVTLVDKVTLHCFINEGFLQRYTLPRAKRILNGLDIQLKAVRNDLFDGFVPSSASGFILPAAAFLTEFKAHICNGVQIREPQFAKIRRMCRASGNEVTMLWRIRQSKREWSGYGAYRPATGEIILTHDGRAHMVQISEIVKRCSPFLLWPNEESDRGLIAYLREGRRFYSEADAREFVGDVNDDTEDKTLNFIVF